MDEQFIIDNVAFVRSHRRLQAHLPLTRFTRFNSAVTRLDSEVLLSLTGIGSQVGHPQLVLMVNADVWLICQRCLQPFLYPLRVESTFIIASQAEELDALDNDDADAIAADSEFDVLALVEDELLLALPIAPRHVQCISVQQSDREIAHPFAALAQWSAK